MSSPPNIVVVVGPLCAGKSTVSALIQQYCVHRNLGCTVISLDKVGHEVLERPAIVASVVAALGQQVLDESSQINREEVAKIVFNDQSSLDALNYVTHPVILQQALVLIDEALVDSDAVVVEAPFPIQQLGPLAELARVVISVGCRGDLRVQRAVKRGLTSDAALKRSNVQPDPALYHVNADAVLDNEGDLEQLNEHLVSVLDTKLVEE